MVIVLILPCASVEDSNKPLFEADILMVQGRACGGCYKLPATKGMSDMETIRKPFDVEALDVEALAAAQEMLGTKTPEDTVNEALRHEVKRKLVERYIRRMTSAEGDTNVREDAWPQ